MKAFPNTAALLFVSLLGIASGDAVPTWLPDTAELNYEAFCGGEDGGKHAPLHHTMHLCFLGEGDITQQILQDPQTTTSGYYSTNKQNFVLVPFKPNDKVDRAVSRSLFTKDYIISINWDKDETVTVTVARTSGGSNRVLLTSGFYTPGNVDQIHLYEHND